MKTKLNQILERCLNGRKIAVWGTPTRLLLRELKGYDYHIADRVDCEKHYIVTVTDDDLTDFMLDEQSKSFKDVYDYICFSDLGKELPFEWELFGAKIGRQTYFGKGVAEACENGYIESIGRYTSINSSVLMHVDHHRNMSFISDEVEDYFTDENRELYKQRYKEDAKHPYASGKAKLTIGNDVWMGANAFINCSKVTSIGDGAIIGSGAVVTCDVPPYAIVAGVPAEIKGYRYEPEMIETLLNVKWWNWDADEINKNVDSLMFPDIFMECFHNKNIKKNK